jgi:hypothetical protein
MDAVKIVEKLSWYRYGPDNPALAALQCLEVDCAVAVVDAFRRERQHLGNTSAT